MKLQNSEGRSTGRQQSAKFIPLGTITKAHGLRGEVKVRPETASPENFTRYRQIFLSPAGSQDKVPCVNLQTRVNGSTVILRLEGCATREEAESLIGHRLWLDQADLPPVGPDEFYLCDLEGKTAMTPSGEVLGTIAGVLSTGGHNLLVVRRDNVELLVPAVKTFIVEIAASHVVLDPPPGLLELNL